MKNKYILNHKVNLAAGISTSILLKVQESSVCYLEDFSAAAEGQPVECALYEAPTVSDDGTPKPSVAINRFNEGETSVLTYTAPTVSDDGDLLFQKPINVSFGFGQFLARETEYLYTVTNNGDAAIDVYISLVIEETTVPSDGGGR